MAKKDKKVVAASSEVIEIDDEEPLPIEILNDEPIKREQNEFVYSAPQYLLELAKSNRAECKRCGNKIEKGELRVGVVNEGKWGLFTKWQHVKCTVFHAGIQNAMAIDGFVELPEAMQVLVSEQVEESRGKVDPDRVAVDPSGTSFIASLALP